MLLECDDKEAIENALRNIPETLEESYEQTLIKIPEGEKNRARSILLWLAFSLRPLTLQEVAAAASLDHPSDVLRICTSSLVTLSQQDLQICNDTISCEVVQLAHFSVKEFLVSKLKTSTNENASYFFVPMDLAHVEIRESCLSYLLQTNEVDPLWDPLKRSHLLQYSAEYWFQHPIGNVNVKTEEVTALVDKLFCQEYSQSYLNWLRIHDPDYGRRSFKAKKFLDSFAQPLYYASLLGLLDNLERLLKQDVDVNAPGGEYGNALQAASASGHDQIVQRLLEKGADVNAQGGEYGVTSNRRDDYSASGVVHPTEYLKNRFQHRFLTSTNPRNTMARPLYPPNRKTSQPICQVTKPLRNYAPLSFLDVSTRTAQSLHHSDPLHLAGVFVSLGWSSETCSAEEACGILRQ
jgi:hypothetical protein